MTYRNVGGVNDLVNPGRAEGFDLIVIATFTGEFQLARLRDAGLSVGLMPELADLDTPSDVAAVARLAPGSRFTAACARAGVFA